MSIAILSNESKNNSKLDSYKYKFITKINKGAEYPVRLLFYKFKSTKTKKTYHVHVEIHPYNFFGIKFFLKDHKNEKDKFCISTNLNEPRPVIYTCINIMLDILKDNPRATFGFIGSRTKKQIIWIGKEKKIVRVKEELEENTKRLRVYRMILLTFIKQDVFEHIIDEEKSTYILANKKSIKDDNELLNKIENYFVSNFDF